MRRSSSTRSWFINAQPHIPKPFGAAATAGSEALPPPPLERPPVSSSRRWMMYASISLNLGG